MINELVATELVTKEESNSSHLRMISYQIISTKFSNSCYLIVCTDWSVVY